MILVARQIHFHWARNRDMIQVGRPMHATGRENNSSSSDRVMIQVARPLHLNVSKSVGESDTIIHTSRPKLFNVHLRDALDVKRSFVLATTDLYCLTIYHLLKGRKRGFDEYEKCIHF